MHLKVIWDTLSFYTRLFRWFEHWNHYNFSWSDCWSCCSACGMVSAKTRWTVCILASQKFSMIQMLSTYCKRCVQCCFQAILMVVKVTWHLYLWDSLNIDVMLLFCCIWQLADSWYFLFTGHLIVPSVEELVCWTCWVYGPSNMFNYPLGFVEVRHGTES